MKIKPVNSKTCQKIKEQFKQKFSESKKAVGDKIKETGEYVSPRVKVAAQKAAEWADDKINDPKIKDTVRKAAGWADEKINDAKNTYETLKQKYNQYTMAPPKIDVLRKKVTNLQKEFLVKSVVLNNIKRICPNNTELIYRKEKELQELEKKAQAAIDEYNKFAAQQAAAQKAFDELNGIKR